MDENQNFPNFDKEAEGLQQKGDWRQFNLWQRGMEEEANCKLVPKTCHMIRAMTEATGCRRGQIKYRSVFFVYYFLAGLSPKWMVYCPWTIFSKIICHCEK